VSELPPENGGPVRLKPRPLTRPPVDATLEAVFGRPARALGSFDRTGDQGSNYGRGLPVAPPLAESLVEAFGRPPDAEETLQRDPRSPDVVAEPAVDDNPWRDLNSVTSFGRPGIAPSEDEKVELGPPERFRLRDVLFEKRLRPRTLVALVALALLIGGLGAGIGALVVSRLPAPAGEPSFSLATATPVEPRPPGSIADVAARVSPAVVSIEIRVGDTGGSGSGIVLDKNGYILTNNHVASVGTADGAQLSVVFYDGSRVGAEIVARDIRTDLAVIKVETDNLVVAQLGDSSALEVGDPVIAIGSPLGLSGTVTTGIVSALNRPVRLVGEGTDTDAVIDAIQTDAPINPGNSGGALVDASGAVIGINSAIRTLGDSAASGSIGLGFAIPINYGKDIAQQLITTGKAVHSTIGVDARSVTDGTTLGAQVQNVRDGSPAQAAGIVEGDVITRVGDRDVGSADELTVAVQGRKVGETVAVELARSGRSMTVDVTLAAE
jgi:S1-C subfamily serine protease